MSAVSKFAFPAVYMFSAPRNANIAFTAIVIVITWAALGTPGLREALTHSGSAIVSIPPSCRIKIPRFAWGVWGSLCSRTSASGVRKWRGWGEELGRVGVRCEH